MTIKQIVVGNEYRYRDEQTGREYTADEARSLAVPINVVYLVPKPWAKRGRP
jgi:hypothetical protein